MANKLLNHIGLSQKIDCIKLFSNIRNTIHNNGVYTREDKNISYNGKPYKFEKYKSPNYGDYLDLLVLEILPDVFKVLDKMISELLNEKIIEDPFAKSHSIV